MILGFTGKGFLEIHEQSSSNSTLSVLCTFLSVLCTFLGIRRIVRLLPPPSPPPHTNMGWCDERDGASLPYLTDQQQQQQQHRGYSPLFTQTLELYRACVAAGQRARFSVEQRAEGEYISFSCKPPAAAATAAAAAKRKQKKKPNKRRVELQRIWQENRSGRRIAAAAQQQLQREPSNSHQQQAVSSSSNSCSSKGPPATALSLDSCQHVQHQLLPVPCPHSRQHAQQQQLQCQ